MPSRVVNALIASMFVLVLRTPSIVLAQSAPLIECAYKSQAQVFYLAWDRSGTIYPNGCTPWDGFAVTDPSDLDAHVIYGWTLFPQIRNDGAAILACTISFVVLETGEA